MSSWGAGYVTDIEYIEAFHPQQAPQRMALACLLNGVAADLPAPDDPVQVLELGSGRGLNALVAAASNPGWRITAIDYNPTHVAMARETARAARLENVRFLEADLATLAGSEAASSVPSVDFATLHGVWTWVAPEVRAGIVRLLRDKVVPGGLVHVGYNAMPGWQGALGLRRLVYEAGRRSATRSDRQAEAGLAFAREALTAEAKHLQPEIARQLIEQTGRVSVHYLSHEFMNAHWEPVYHSELADALGEAKLDFVGSANLVDNFPQLMLSDAQRALHDRHDDPRLRELVKDVSVGRTFRHDVFVRGPRRLPLRETTERLEAIELAGVLSPDELVSTIEVPAGKAEMSETLAGMMRACLEGEGSVRELLALAPGRSSAAELIGVLVGSGQADVASGAVPVFDPGSAASRLNRILGERITSLAGPAHGGAFACARAGSGVPAPKLEQFVGARLIGGETVDRADAWARALAEGASDEDGIKIGELVRGVVERRLPRLRRLGIVPP